MQRIAAAFITCFILGAVTATAQDSLPGTLPNITVKNLNGQIVVSWINRYKMPVSAISIQRSYDSLKNYTTIGSVLNPQNEENGYADAKPPYNKMYYRVFISFDGGNYVFSKIARPVKELIQPIDPADTAFTYWNGRDKSPLQGINDPRKNGQIPIQPKTPLPNINANEEIITYPSRRIYTGKDNNVIIVLPDAETKKYTVKFFQENDAPLFELNKIHESFLIVEKVNFVHSGWFKFEVYESGKLIEKNKFYVPKDGKNQTIPPPPQ